MQLATTSVILPFMAVQQPFTRVAAAEFLHLSVRTLDRLLANGDLEYVQVGRRRLIPAAAVERFLATPSELAERQAS